MNGESLASLVPGLKPVDPLDFTEYERAMREEAIPEMLAERARRQRSMQLATIGDVEAIVQRAIEERVATMLRQAQKEVQPIIDRERAGEHVTAETMNFVLR